MKINDTVVGAGFVAAGAAIFIATLRFPRLEGGAPGPSLFPQVLAALMVIFGASLGVTAVTKGRPGTSDSALPYSQLTRRSIVNALLVFAAILLFMLVSPTLGFLGTTAAILLGLMWWLGTPVWRAAIASVGLTLFVYVIFGKLLRVPLPLGLLWF